MQLIFVDTCLCGHYQRQTRACIRPSNRRQSQRTSRRIYRLTNQRSTRPPIRPSIPLSIQPGIQRLTPSPNRRAIRLRIPRKSPPPPRPRRRPLSRMNWDAVCTGDCVVNHVHVLSCNGRLSMDRHSRDGHVYCGPTATHSGADVLPRRYDSGRHRFEH